MSFPPPVAEKAMVAAGRHCVLCHKFCGIKMELHHIKHSSEGGPDTFENCIPLCFDCHGDMRSYDFKHSKGKKYTESELIAHRDRWYARMAASGGEIASLEHAELDRKVWLQFRAEFPYEPTVRFLKERSTTAPFPNALLTPVYDFIDNSADPAREYLDADLESLRVELRDAAMAFTGAVGSFMSVYDSSNRLMFASELKHSHPEVYYKQAADLQELESNVTKCYDDLVRSARRKLGIDA